MQRATQRLIPCSDGGATDPCCRHDRLEAVIALGNGWNSVGTAAWTKRLAYAMFSSRCRSSSPIIMNVGGSPARSSARAGAG
jgi:hypothetical protein